MFLGSNKNTVSHLPQVYHIQVPIQAHGQQPQGDNSRQQLGEQQQ